MILGLVTGVLVLLAALLLLPVRLRAEATSAPARVLVELGLAGGLVRLRLVDSAQPRAPRARSGRRQGGRARRRVSARVARAAGRAALEALGRVRVDRLRGEARVGLGDPALTGEFWGRAAGVLAALPVGGLRLVPVFDRSALEGEAELALSLVPARLLPVAARFLWALR